MGRFFIDGSPVDFTEGMTILEAASKAGITIPSLCDMPGFRHNASCMVCVVKDMQTNRFVPSCASAAVENMRVISRGNEIDHARHESLSMLLAEHTGDCEGPCTRGCPAGFDIPGTMRFLAAGDSTAAASLLSAATPIPETLGLVCPAPCEKTCRRRLVDQPVSIRLVHRFAGHAANMAAANAVATEIHENSPAGPVGKKILVIGSGPAGLTAAFFLARLGYCVTIQEKSSRAGGGLREALAAHGVSAESLELEISRISRSGVRIVTDKPFDFTQIKPIAEENDAVIVACRMIDGTVNIADAHKNIFIAGHPDRSSRMAVRASAAGKHASLAVHAFLETGNPSYKSSRFDSHMHDPDEKELAFFMSMASGKNRMEPVHPRNGFSPEEVRIEAARCLSCDCAKKNSCDLRETADSFCDWKRRCRLDTKKRFSRIDSHELVCYEPGKCIVCGRCVQITEAAGELTGLCFVGRGFQVTVSIPLDRKLSEALTTTARRCVQACPTGALSFHRNDFHRNVTPEK